MCLPVENKKAHPEYRQSLILPYDFRIEVMDSDCGKG